MDGKINQQGTSYRRGLVLGLTMAEIMLLLVFCLLIAMTTFLRREQDNLARAQHELAEQRANTERNAAVLDSLKRQLAEKLSATAGLDPAAVDAYWRDLVESKASLNELAKEGTSLAELKEKAAATDTLRKAGIDNNKALRDAEIVSAIKRTLPEPDRIALTPKSAADLAARASKTPGDGGGNRFPPIISLTEEHGYTFRTGSAELVPAFKEALTTTTLDKILATIKQYDVDVIEVVGHTDEQAYGPRLASTTVDRATPITLSPPVVVSRSSNLDRGLVAVLNNTNEIGKLTPADNAGLGLARAVSVVAELRKSEKLAGYKLIPLSGGQLIDTNENLALNGTAGGDIAQRRRIEIRLRKSTPHEAAVSILPSTPPVQAQPRQKPPRRAAHRSTATTLRPAALAAPSPPPPAPPSPLRRLNPINLLGN
jgi:outer membrane protein OmpA-like peptidoglycan-associated protein